MITQCGKPVLRKENFVNASSDKALLKQKRKYFVGNVTLRDLSAKLNIRDQKVYLAGFKNGAKTKLHYHQGDQTLVVTKGKGVLVLYRKASTKNKQLKIRLDEKSSLRQGDVVLIPKKTLHWHGAIPGNNFEHIALNAFHKGKESQTIWYDSDFTSSAVRMD